MNRTSSLVAAVAALFVLALAVAPVSAHCGSCGVGDDHKHAEGHTETAVAKADIVDTAVAAGSFKTLVAAVKAAGLVETLKGEGPFTVFAPTDDAFAALPEGTVESLLKPENKEKLIAILTYHVVAAKVPAEVAVTLKAGETLNGQSFKVNFDKKTEKLMIDGATVVKADIMTSNGIIHVIDKVLIPAEPKASR